MCTNCTLACYIERMTTNIVCQDCQKPFEYKCKGQGFLPKRCPECTRAFRYSGRVRRRRVASGTPEIGELRKIACKHCGSEFEREHRGRNYKRICQRCQRAIWAVNKQVRRGRPVSLDVWIEALKAFQCRCAYCGSAQRIEIEHFVPVVLGGTSDPGNILPACRSCNARKNATPPEVWLSAEQYDAIVKVLESLRSGRTRDVYRFLSQTSTGFIP